MNKIMYFTSHRISTNVIYTYLEIDLYVATLTVTVMTAVVWVIEIGPYHSVPRNTVSSWNEACPHHHDHDHTCVHKNPV